MTNARNLSSTIDSEIRPDERVLWKGRPLGGVRFRSSDWLLIPASLLWAGFVIFWEIIVLSIPKLNAAAYLFPLFGLPFVLIGLYLTIGRFFVDAKMRENTEYALTTRRAIIKSGIFSKSVKSLNLKVVPDISLTERGDGVGTITFADPMASMVFARRRAWPGTGIGSPPAFDLIENARAVYDQVLKAQSASSG